MANAIEIRERLRDWLEGRASLHQFEDWFVPATWNAHRVGDAEAESLVDDIELHLSEYSGGASTLEQIRQALQELANAARPFVAGSLIETRNPTHLVIDQNEGVSSEGTGAPIPLVFAEAA